MRKAISKILVTGGAGFIGSAFVRLVSRGGNKVAVLDKLCYAADLKRLQEVKGKFKFFKADICDKFALDKIISSQRPEIVVHFAAETHVDRSIIDADCFIDTNVKGTQVLLESCRKHKIKKFIHISTDEVYGEIKQGKFFENSPLYPNSPYSASKAAADLIIRSYIRTYNFPAIIIRPCNNYGPWQYPEKFIARSILRILKDKKIAIYAKGENVREWLHVDDCAQGILKVVHKGKIGQIYNLGSGQAKKNIDVAKLILKQMNKDEGMFEFVKDRPGHDFRYRLDSKKIFADTGWKARFDFKEGLRKYIGWCYTHRLWILGKAGEVERLYR
ncbi:MAG: dTDP-glucose 4,6-dehydratase [Candidatus Omnitrophica bacterium]|nr:dTDP-glucose 4,6-dehydratase [Candidatus Omnitrophota bacterium]